QSLTRRGALGALAALAATSIPPALASPAGGAPLPKPDADLLALGELHDTAHAGWLAVWRRWKAWEAEWRQIEPTLSLPGEGEEKFDAWFAARSAHGADAHIDAVDAALDLVEEIEAAIREIPATTFAGLAIKARVV